MKRMVVIWLATVVLVVFTVDAYSPESAYGLMRNIVPSAAGAK